MSNLTNIADVVIGSRYVLAAKGKTPETYVVAVSVKGRWVRVRAEFNGAEMNVGAKELTPFVEQAEIKAKANARLAELPDSKAGAAKPSTRTPGYVCPECGSTEVYHGRVVRGIVVDEETVWGCHACGWDNIPQNGCIDPTTRVRYVRTKLDGGYALDNNDHIANMLRGEELDQVYHIAAIHLGVDEHGLRAQYAHLNVGMQRMNLGNRLRKAMRREPMEQMVAAVRAYAVANYDRDGWDVVVEAMDDTAICHIINPASNSKEAIKLVRAVVKAHKAYGDDIRAA